MNTCKHPDCTNPLFFLYENARLGFIFERRSKCHRQYVANVKTLRLLPESTNQTPGSDHDCRRDLGYCGLRQPDVPTFICKTCHKLFALDEVEFKHYASFAVCAS